MIISAGIEPDGVTGRILHDWVLRRFVQTVVCPSITAEYRDVSERSKFACFQFPPEWRERLIAWSINLPEPPRWPKTLPDPKDEPFLALAHSANALLITGNLKHFPESACAGVKVLSPNEYLAHLLHED